MKYEDQNDGRPIGLEYLKVPGYFTTPQSDGNPGFIAPVPSAP